MIQYSLKTSSSKNWAIEFYYLHSLNESLSFMTLRGPYNKFHVSRRPQECGRPRQELLLGPSVVWPISGGQKWPLPTRGSPPEDVLQWFVSRDKQSQGTSLSYGLLVIRLLWIVSRGFLVMDWTLGKVCGFVLKRSMSCTLCFYFACPMSKNVDLSWPFLTAVNSIKMYQIFLHLFEFSWYNHKN